MCRNRFGRGFGPIVWQITDVDEFSSVFNNLTALQCMTVHVSAGCEVSTIEIETCAWIINQMTSQEMEGSSVYRLGFPPTTIPFVSLMNVSAPLFHVRDAISMWESLWKTSNRIHLVSASVSLPVYRRLTLWRRNYFFFFLILAHLVYKMWIIQEPKKLALWNKLHFEEKKKRRV